MFKKINLQFFAESGATDGAQGQQTGQTNTDAGTGTNNAQEGNTDPQNTFQPTPEMQEWLQKQLQSETDKVRTQYSKQLRQLETEKDNLLKEKMTEEEKAQFELDKQKRELFEKEQALKRQTVELEATNLLTDAQVPLKFREFVLGEDVETTKQRINDFKKLWDEAVSEEVTKRMAAGGRQAPPTNNQGNTGKSMNDLIRNAFGR